MEEITSPKYTDEITFSKEAGAYPDSSIALDIESKDGLKVRYTTDGSMPSKQKLYVSGSAQDNVGITVKPESWKI